MYGEARQKEGGASTSLGSWRGFEDGHSTLLFDGGQQCWNGPQRSMRVRPLPLRMACKPRVSWSGGPVHHTQHPAAHSQVNALIAWTPGVAALRRGGGAGQRERAQPV